MMSLSHSAGAARRFALALLFLALGPSSTRAQEPALEQLLDRASKHVSTFVEQFSDVKCTERVTQEKLGEKDKVLRRAESTYDYLVILSNVGGELTLDESRLEVTDPKQAKKEKKDKEKNQSNPLLISNGFATLFLIFHPYYSNSFQFSALGDEMVDGRRLTKVHFQHIRNTRSVAALAVRGREYPLELSGIAWLDPGTGMIAKITAGVDSGVEDIGMKSLRSEVQFSPVRFAGSDTGYWFPSQATVDVETPRQRWRNTHYFSEYKKFSVSTEEQVAKQ